mgnify:CR=1 FL=1
MFTSFDSLGSITDITTDGSGTFKIIGLDDEIDYTLVEKTAPPGYNKAENVVFKLSSGYNTNGNQLDSLSATIRRHAGQKQFGRRSQSIRFKASRHRRYRYDHILRFRRSTDGCCRCTAYN